jgi:hypothetical protein
MDLECNIRHRYDQRFPYLVGEVIFAMNSWVSFPFRTGVSLIGFAMAFICFSFLFYSVAK